MHVRASDLADWIRLQAAAAGARGLVVALDGSLESTVVAGLCQQAVPGGTVGVIMPSRRRRDAAAHAHLVAGHFRLRSVLVDVQPAQDQLMLALQESTRQITTAPAPGLADDAPSGPDAPEEGLESRLHMAALHFVASALHALVAGTLTRCDLIVGHFTAHGSGGADVFPLGSVLASEVLPLAHDLGVPDTLIPPPAAGDGDPGFTYDLLERYRDGGPEAVAPAVALRIERQIRNTAHKRAPLLTPDAGA